MIYYFIKQSGGGKSALATAFMTQFMEVQNTVNRDTKELLGFLEMTPRDRLKLSHKLTDYFNSKGYNFKKAEHTVWSNLGMWTRRFGKEITNYDMPLHRVGLYDKKYVTWTPAPGGIVVMDEMQEVADGRDSMSLPTRTSAYAQLHRKWRLDLLLFSQRDKVDKQFRENCKIILITDMKHKKDKYGFIVSTTWTLLVFEDFRYYEAYKGSMNSKYYKETKYTFYGCIFDHYDSHEGEEYFAECAAKHGGISLRKAEKKRTTREDFNKFVTNHPYTAPSEYRKGAKK